MIKYILFIVFLNVINAQVPNYSDCYKDEIIKLYNKYSMNPEILKRSYSNEIISDTLVESVPREAIINKIHFFETDSLTIRIAYHEYKKKWFLNYLYSKSINLFRYFNLSDHTLLSDFITKTKSCNPEINIDGLLTIIYALYIKSPENIDSECRILFHFYMTDCIASEKVYTLNSMELEYLPLE